MVKKPVGRPRKYSDVVVSSFKLDRQQRERLSTALKERGYSSVSDFLVKELKLA